MKRFIPIILSVVLVFTILVLSADTASACPACKNAIEKATANGDNTAVGLNIGIFYLLSMPYVLFSVLFLLWYRNYRKNKVVVG